MCWNLRRSSSTNALPELNPLELLESTLPPARFTADVFGLADDAGAPAGVPPGDLHSIAIAWCIVSECDASTRVDIIEPQRLMRSHRSSLLLSSIPEYVCLP